MWTQRQNHLPLEAGRTEQELETESSVGGGDAVFDVDSCGNLLLEFLHEGAVVCHPPTFEDALEPLEESSLVAHRGPTDMQRVVDACGAPRMASRVRAVMRVPAPVRR